MAECPAPACGARDGSHVCGRHDNAHYLHRDLRTGHVWTNRDRVLRRFGWTDPTGKERHGE